MELINLCFVDDLFLFAHGDANSTQIIMESLDEFKNVSGLVLSLPKSTAYFCNVLNYIKYAILQIMPFEEGRLPVKYLGVSLVSSRLVFKDCKELIERVESRLNDWKNKVLSFAAAHAWVPLSHGDTGRVKAKVARDVVCLLKEEGGLGIRRLDHFNKALMVSHIWKLLQKKESLWVTWLYLYKIKDRNFWEIPFRGNMSWGWRKILQLRPLIRKFIWHKVGDGSRVSIWYDQWCGVSPLSNIVSSRDMYRVGLNPSSMVDEVLVDGNLAWPSELCVKYPIISSILVPHFGHGSGDSLEWRNNSGLVNPLLVSTVWHSIRPRVSKVDWVDVVWYSNCIPRHVAHMWLIIKRRLKTQDQLRSWLSLLFQFHQIRLRRVWGHQLDESSCLFDPSEDPSSDHIPPLPASSPFLSSTDDSLDSDIPDTPPSPTHGTPFTETTLSTQRSPVASGALRRRVMVLAPGQPIPHGRSYCYHLNGSVHMMTARKRVGALPTYHLAVRHSVDYSSSDHFSSDDSSRDSSSSSSSESSSNSSVVALSDYASSRSSSDHSSPTQSSDMRPSHHLCSLVLSIHRSSVVISKRPCHDSSSASPSRKRSRSPAASVPLSLPTLGALSYACADLLPSPKRIRSPETAMDLEGCSEDSFKPYVPREVGLGVDFEDESFESSRHRGTDLEIEVTYETLGDLVQRFHDHTEEILVRRVQLERNNIRLRDMMDVASQRVARTMPNTQSGASRTCEGINELIDRQLAGALGSRNGNGRNGNSNENGGGNGYNFGGFMPARECTYQDFLKCQLLSFNGTEGVVGLTRWFEKMETVFYISNYPEKYQVKYASCTLLNSALTWWNSHKRTIGIEAAF
ncbi:putative reverse transcriptase domain-containing protein [Tanacetum coccineum]